MRVNCGIVRMGCGEKTGLCAWVRGICGFARVDEGKWVENDFKMIFKKAPPASQGGKKAGLRRHCATQSQRLASSWARSSCS
jgi:hypothetical protein